MNVLLTPDYGQEYLKQIVSFSKIFCKRKHTVKFSSVGSWSFLDQTDCGLVGGSFGRRRKQVALGLEMKRLGDPLVILFINNIMRQLRFIYIRSK